MGVEGALVTAWCLFSIDSFEKKVSDKTEGNDKCPHRQQNDFGDNRRGVGRNGGRGLLSESWFMILGSNSHILNIT